MKDIAIVTNDQRLVEKIRLSLLGDARVFGLYEAPINPEAYDKLLFDLRGERRAPRLISTYGDAGFDGIDTDEYATVVSGNSDHAYHADLARELGGIVIRWREDVGEGELPYPFTYRELGEALSGERRKKVRLFIESERVARLDAKTIKLTEVEGRLLRLLVDGGGEFVSREELAKKVWGENADGGVLNVYIHYLREKLEAGGEKIILSSRKGGYRIDERFLGGKDADAD